MYFVIKFQFYSYSFLLFQQVHLCHLKNYRDTYSNYEVREEGPKIKIDIFLNKKLKRKTHTFSS